jgi:hypothetical protein
MKYKFLVFYLFFLSLFLICGCRCNAPKVHPIQDDNDTTKADTSPELKDPRFKDTAKKMTRDTAFSLPQAMAVQTDSIDRRYKLKRVQRRGIKEKVSPNSTTAVPPDTKSLKYGILGYSYPRSITVGNSKNIHAFISIKFPEGKVRDTVYKLLINDDPSQKDDSIVTIKQIPLYHIVTINLTCLDTILKVTQNNPSAKQELDTLSGNKWSWTIYAKTADHPSSKLKLTILTEGPSNYEEKTITINIKVEPHFVRKIYDWLIDNPKVLIVSILIPLFAFFGRLFLKKNKTHSDDPDNDS